ncbi:MAG TPA: DegV family protein [Dehalococcoidia bacterium]|nr:DegV family protein [Dehalococcoidia bacterium]
MVVRVVTDSACDIPPEIARKLSVTVVPLYIQIGDKTYRDGIDITADRVCHELVYNRELPKTSVPSPGDFINTYNNLATETDQIISIHLPPEYSGTYGVAKLASGYIGDKCRVEIIDSNSVSVGLGLIVMAAARAAQEGKNLDQIVDLIHQTIPRIGMFGKVDNFVYILRGKRFRLTRGLTLLGKVSMALRIKLLGEVYDGGKIRSPTYVIGRSMALNRLKRWAKNFPDVKEIAIAYSTAPDEAEMLAGRLEVLIPREHILITKLGCVTSTYVGPGTLVMALV